MKINHNLPSPGPINQKLLNVLREFKGGDFAAIDHVLSQGADINVNDGMPLNILAQNGQLEAVKFLLDKGAVINNKTVGDLLKIAIVTQTSDEPAKTAMLNYLFTHKSVAKKMKQFCEDEQLQMPLKWKALFLDYLLRTKTKAETFRAVPTDQSDKLVRISPAPKPALSVTKPLAATKPRL